MKITDIKNFDFITDENYRYKISPRKAGNTMVLNAVLQTLKNEGYKFYRLFGGGYIYAEK